MVELLPPDFRFRNDNVGGRRVLLDVELSSPPSLSGFEVLLVRVGDTTKAPLSPLGTITGLKGPNSTFSFSLASHYENVIRSLTSYISTRLVTETNSFAKTLRSDLPWPGVTIDTN